MTKIITGLVSEIHKHGLEWNKKVRNGLIEVKIESNETLQMTLNGENMNSVESNGT